jgi:hypothetical protein
MVELSVTEVAQLEQCEKTIQRGLATFIDVGQALAHIRDNRLYRTHGTFEEYCEKRWDLSARHANRLVEAASVNLVLGPTGPELNNEAQARELTPLLDDPEELKAAWQEAVERSNGKPTAAVVRDVVQGKLKQTDPVVPSASPVQLLGENTGGEVAAVSPQPSVADLQRQVLPQQLLKEIAVASERVCAIARGVRNAVPPLDEQERVAVETELGQLAEIITLLRTSLTVGDLDAELVKLLEDGE